MIERYICSTIEHKMENNQDYLNLLRKIKNKPQSSQRELAEELGFSLGKLNYCLKALKTKGLINYEENLNSQCNWNGGLPVGHAWYPSFKEDIF